MKLTADLYVKKLVSFKHSVNLTFTCNVCFTWLIFATTRICRMRWMPPRSLTSSAFTRCASATGTSSRRAPRAATVSTRASTGSPTSSRSSPPRLMRRIYWSSENPFLLCPHLYSRRGSRQLAFTTFVIIALGAAGEIRIKSFLLLISHLFLESENGCIRSDAKIHSSWYFLKTAGIHYTCGSGSVLPVFVSVASVTTCPNLCVVNFVADIAYGISQLSSLSWYAVLSFTWSVIVSVCCFLRLDVKCNCTLI